jgi:hypothetical protein
VESANGKPAIAIAFISVGSAVVAWQASAGPTAKSATRIFGKLAVSWLVLVLAFVLTTRAIQTEFGGGGDEKVRPSGMAGAGGQYWGVMLWTDHPPPDPQLAQNLPRSNPSLTYKSLKIPTRIRFNGVYWFFQWPNRRPPPTAAVMFGMPDAIGFHSTDFTPLVMEAHQLLPGHIELDCCSRIEVEVRNADAFPGTIAVELLLNDSTAPLIHPTSLGMAVAGELESFQQKSRDVTLSYAIPEFPPIPAFNSITFRFYPNARRRTVSPRIAIRDLTLIPR